MDSINTPTSPATEPATSSATSVAPTPSKASYKKRGSPHMPPRQTYHAAKGHPRIKRMTEALKRAKGRKLTPEERDALAFFSEAYQWGNGER